MLYEQISSNKHKTWFLISLFSVVIVLLGWAFGNWMGDVYSGISLALIISVTMSLVGYFKGDAVALTTSGAQRIEKQDNPELYRIVENLAIAAGLPTPKIYIMTDVAINAFATGRDPNHASIAVTSGALQALDKQELEGVLSHELSHIGNYDIRVMTIVVVLVGVILLLSDMMTRSMFFGRGRRSNDNNDNGGIFLIIGIVLAILSPIFAQLIKLAVSRQREYLADASGCLLTRYPEGLVRALEKISAQDQPMAKANHATAHMFLANPFDPHVTKKFEQLFSTHPPIEERIRRLKEAGL
ncbi:MAG: zinc metalloprotease HtpX [Candidatus Uhrbacteria bacterium]|nr:zinc metalloprotease HtpX [Candidatus Uhrbacteria bacterium]